MDSSNTYNSTTTLVSDYISPEAAEFTNQPELDNAELERAKKLQSTYLAKALDLTEEQQKFIDEKLGSKLWRMNNLYKIRDKDGVLVTLKLNAGQEKVVKNFKHTRKIILKSRQRGISTLYLAYNLDDCLFKPGFSAGIQSYGLDESNKLQQRAQLMWDELDENVKQLFGLKLVMNNQKGMMFNNGSVLKIGNFRGDTLQSLHVSELGKIAKRYPDKAKELKTGAFQAVGKRNKITIESTAEGKTGLFYEMWQRAEIRAAQGVLGPFDFQPIFLSWVDDGDCLIDVPYPTQEYDNYFSEIEERLGITLKSEQKWWYVSKAEELGTDMKQEYPTFPEEAFEQSVEGTYYQKQYTNLVSSGRIKQLDYDPFYPVYAIFDLGMNDQMCINFVQVINGVPKILREYDNNGEGIEYYVNILQSMPFPIKIVYLPHDANVKELGTGRTRIEEFRRHGVVCTLLARQSIQDGINAARQYLDIVEIDESCTSTIDAIQNYRQKFDAKLGVYTGSPLHDEHSHYADVIRYSSLALTFHRIKGTEPQDKIAAWRKKKSRFVSGFAI